MKAVIHIGTCKTGTSTIQEFLYKNQKRLKKQNLFIPSGLIPPFFNGGHLKLGVTTYIPAAWESWPLFAYLGHFHFTNIVRKDFPSLEKTVTPQDQNKLWNKYRHEIVTNCSGDHLDLVVFSTESLSLFLENEVERFKELMNSLFDDVTIVLYLRRQPEFLVSFYYTYVMGGAMPWRIFDYLNQPDDRSVLAYDQIVKRWSIFGKDKIKIRLFDKQVFHKNDLLSDFAATAGFDLTGLERVENRNETSLDSAEIEFLRLYNSHMPRLLDPWTINPDRFPLLDLIWSHSRKDDKKNKKAWYLNREEARRILEQYREGNVWIAREYLGREKLFDEDVSMYPETVVSPHGLTVEKCAEITAHLCKELHAGKYAFGIGMQSEKGTVIPHHKITKFHYHRYRLLSNITFGKLRAKYNAKRKTLKTLLNEKKR